MNARPGDWLVVKSSSDSRRPRRAAILAVSGNGTAPYTVRWMDTGHEAIVFPGPDAEVITAVRQAELDHEQAQRAARVQSEIRRHVAPRA